MGAGSQEAWCPALTTTLPSTPTPISVYEPPFPGLGGGGVLCHPEAGCPEDREHRLWLQ